MNDAPTRAWALPATGAPAMFSASANGAARAPFLLEMARDLSAATCLSVTSGAKDIPSGIWASECEPDKPAARPPPPERGQAVKPVEQRRRI